MFCSQCGKQINDDSRFCSKCGSITSITSTGNIDISLQPSVNFHTTNNTDEKMEIEINQDVKQEPIPSPKTKWTLDTPIFTKIFKNKTKPPEPIKKGFGWFIVLLFYVKSLFPSGELRGGNIYSNTFEFLGFFGVLIIYFKIRKYLGRYYFGYETPKSYFLSFTSGVISLVLIYVIVISFSLLFRNF